MKAAYRRHLKSSDDLVTTYEQVRAGFVALALERNRRATPFVEEARALKATAFKAESPALLLKIPGIQAGLLTAAGVSEKAAGHMTDTDKLEAVQGLIANFLEPAGSAFVEELVFRFLLTRGDALGGSMRNFGGALAQRKLTRALIASLRLAGTAYTWLHSADERWLPMEEDDADVELHLRGLSWSSGRRNRTLIYNFTVPLVENNVDFCLLKCKAENLQEACDDPTSYIALGELKGGIDPAGADEHWKTARAALNRIRKPFQKQKLTPHIFFVGAAIAKKMAGEIWAELEIGMLKNAGNLTNQDHVSSICAWITGL